LLLSVLFRKDNFLFLELDPVGSIFVNRESEQERCGWFEHTAKCSEQNLDNCQTQVQCAGLEGIAREKNNNKDKRSQYKQRSTNEQGKQES